MDIDFVWVVLDYRTDHDERRVKCVARDLGTAINDTLVFQSADPLQPRPLWTRVSATHWEARVNGRLAFVALRTTVR